MKKILGTTSALLLTCSGASFAEQGFFDPQNLFARDNFSSSVWLATDYIFRGISNTDEDPAIQGSFDYAHPSGAYVGVWASNSDFSEGGIEIDYYGGFAAELLPGLGYDLSALYYSFPGADDDEAELDYVEAHVGLNYTFSGIPFEPAAGAGFNWSPDFFGEDGDGYYVNGTLDLTLPREFGLGLELGYQEVEGDKTTPDGFSYAHWKVALTKEILGFNLELNGQDTFDRDNVFCEGGICDERVVFLISRTF